MERLKKIRLHVMTSQTNLPMNDISFLVNSLELAIKTLEENANEDFRGNRSDCSVRSYHTLNQIKHAGEL